MFETTFLGRATIVKQRFSKKYRLPVLDAKLTVGRLRQEVRSMLKARRLGVPTPIVYYVEQVGAVRRPGGRGVVAAGGAERCAGLCVALRFVSDPQIPSFSLSPPGCRGLRGPDIRFL